MPASEARMRANAKYNLKAYDRIELKVPKGRKTDLQAHASAQSESLNGFISTAINERVERLQGAQARLDAPPSTSTAEQTPAQRLQADLDGIIDRMGQYGDVHGGDDLSTKLSQAVDAIYGVMARQEDE